MLHQKSKIKWFATGAVILSLMIYILASLLLENSTLIVKPPPVLLATLTKMNVTPVQSRPDYILSVSPEEYSVIPLGVYNHILGIENDYKVIIDASHRPSEQGFQSTICFTLSLEPLIQKGDLLNGIFLEEGHIFERITFLLDGKPAKLANEFIDRAMIRMNPEEESQPGWLEGTGYCWEAPLNVGQHEAIFRFRQTSRDVQEYIWYFEIGE